MTTRRALVSLLLALGLAGLLAGPGIAFAQRSDAGINALKFLDATAEKGGLSSGIKGEGFSSEDPVLAIIGNIINVILGFVGIIFFIQMFYAGFRWMSSGGNEEVVTESRQTIKSAVIGIVIVFGAFVVTNFVLNQIASITGPTRPSAPAPEDESYDPSLDAPGSIPDFGTLPAARGVCAYPTSTECDLNARDWTERESDITENDCRTLAAQSCGDPNLYEWFIPQDPSGDPGLNSGGNFDFGELPPLAEIGTCRYAQTGGECDLGSMFWTGAANNVTQSACSDLVPRECNAETNYQWTQN